MAERLRAFSRRGAAGGIEGSEELWQALEGLAAADICGVGHERLLRTADRTEAVVLEMLVNLVSERQEQLEEQRINRMANEIAKRFG